MEKFKFCTNETTEVGIVSDIESVGIGYPVANSDGGYVVANNDTAIGVVIGLSNKKNEGRLRQFATVMTAGAIDEIEAEGAFGQRYADDAKNAMINITFCDNHEIVTASGGSDPVLDNAKSTGGIGWTESGEQTTITWDGDTEGRESIDGQYYKVSGDVVTEADVIGAQYHIDSLSSDTFTITEESIISASALGIDGFATCPFEPDTPFIVFVTSDSETATKGVYFIIDGDYISSLTYEKGGTIHKIDEKYLPESGSVSKFYIDTRTTGGELVDSTLYIDEERQTEATREDVKGAIGTNILLYDYDTRDVFIPIECCYTKSYQYGFIIMKANPDDLTQVNARFFGYVGIH